jgi:hypothetical protein
VACGASMKHCREKQQQSVVGNGQWDAVADGVPQLRVASPNVLPD